MSVKNLARALHVSFFRPSLESGENERLCEIVDRGRKALGALFLSQLENIAAIEAVERSGQESLPLRQLSFIGFRRAVMAYRPTANDSCRTEFDTAIIDGVRASLRSGNEPFSCDDFSCERFQRSYMGARPPQTLSPRAFASLLRMTHDGEHAMETLLLHNTGLVIKAVMRQRRGNSMREDYLMEGMLGLRRAILHYDKRFGCKLTTFALPLIKRSIYRYIDLRIRLVRLPESATTNLRMVHSAKRAALVQIRKEGGRGDWAPVEEIAMRTKLRPEMVVSLLNASNRNVSTDHPVREELGSTFGDLLTDDRPSAEERLMFTSMKARLEAVMQTALSGRERYVIRERYYGEGRMFKEVADDLGISKQRVHQLEERALAKLHENLGSLDTL